MLRKFILSMAEDNDGFGPAICHTQILNVIKFGNSDVKTFILSFSYFIKREDSGSPYRIIKLFCVKYGMK